MSFLKLFLFVSFLSIGLGGCLDFLDDDDDDEPSSSLTGKAADGYLASAKVCLDLNGNRKCDNGEPSATTGPDGDFTINASTSDVNSATILVEVIAGVTEDKDNPGVKVTKAYSMSAPAGYKFVSPITTLVQAEVEKSGGSVSNAEAVLKARLGTEIDFEDDYVAGQSDAEKSADFQAQYKKLHQVAQVVATIIRNNLDAVAVNKDSDNFKEVLKLVVSKVDVALETINTAVANDSSNDFDPDTFLASNSDIGNTTKVDPETLDDELALQDDIDNAVTADFGALLEAGLFWVEYHDDQSGPEIGYGKTTFNGTTTTNSFFYWDGSDFVLDTSDGGGDSCMDCSNDSELLLTANGWSVANFDEGNDDGPVFDSAEDDGSVLMTQGPLKVRLTGEEFNLTGNKIKGTLSGTGDWEWAGLITTGTTFGTDAKGYKIRMATADDVFIMPEFTNDCTVGENDEDQSGIVGNCNLVRFLNKPGGSLSDNDPTEIQPSSFNPIVTTRGTGTNPLNYKGLILGFDEESDSGFIAEFGPSNTIFYYKVVVQNNAVTSFSKILEAPYAQKTVHGKSLIVFDVPFSLGLAFFDDHDDSNGGEVVEEDHDEGPKPTALFLTAHEGYWRWGGTIEAGTVIPDDAPFVYNQAAMDSIIGGFDSDLIPSSEAP